MSNFYKIVKEVFGFHNVLWFDLETYSEVPLKHGVDRYARECEIMLAPYAINEADPQCWDCTTGTRMPRDLAVALDDPKTLIVLANGGMFDRPVLQHAWGLEFPVERLWDTMVQGYAHSLPGRLEMQGDVFKLAADEAKQAARGKQLIHLFCKPRPKNTKIRRATRETHPDEWQEFISYAVGDITAMRAVTHRMPLWNMSKAERELHFLDLKINNRGMLVDVELATKAVEAVEKRQEELKTECRSMTDELVTSPSKRAQLLEFILAEYGIALADLKKANVERLLSDPDIPDGMRELLRNRLEFSTTSVSKYKALLRAVGPDNRLRFTKQFCGASRTGRWAGRVFQPDNLPRPSMKQKLIDMGIEGIKAGIADILVDDVIALASSAIRGVIIAPPGKKLVVADLANIEGRGQAFLAGEDWKLQAFRDFDAGVGHDAYKLAYARSFGVTPESVTKDQRQIGKVQELALGYEGGVGAFVTFALGYNIDLDELANKALPTIPPHILKEAEGLYDWLTKKKKKNPGVPKQTFVVCDSLKRLWRNAHSNISAYWKDLQQAVVVAYQNPGCNVPVGRLVCRRDGVWMRIRLPSGRNLCYPGIEVNEKGEISYFGINQFSHKWTRIHTHGGKLFENVCQAFARDILAYNLQDIEDNGFETILTVHDEAVTEAPDSEEYTAERLAGLMVKPQPWTEGMPLAAAGFEGYRYRKD